MKKIHIKRHETCKCKCRLNASACNNKNHGRMVNVGPNLKN